VFPAKSSPELKALPAADAAAMTAYSGQLMTNGAQTQTYADHFIAAHLKEIGGGKAYSQLSAEALAQPKNTALAAQVQTVFRGTTLRGLLLNAYAFWQIGQILLIAAIIAFVAGGLMLILAIFGFIHLCRTPVEAGLLGRRAGGETVAVGQQHPATWRMRHRPGFACPAGTAFGRGDGRLAQYPLVPARDGLRAAAPGGEPQEDVGHLADVLRTLAA
jgi:hypothetical protein